MEIVTPNQKAKSIFKTYWDIPRNNFYSAKEATIKDVEMRIEEANFNGSTLASEYYTKVLIEAQNL